MVESANSNSHAKGLVQRALNQMARELLLAQSSDWALIMKTGSHVPYAVERFRSHAENFTALYEDIKSGSLEEGHVKQLEDKNNIFPDIDYTVYCT